MDFVTKSVTNKGQEGVKNKARDLHFHIALFVCLIDCLTNQGKVIKIHHTVENAIINDNFK